MAEEQMNRTDDGDDAVEGALGGGAVGNDVPADRGSDDGTPVGTADVDADRLRSGAADADDVGQGGAPAAFVAGTDDDVATDEGVPVGGADRDADVERSS